MWYESGTRKANGSGKSTPFMVEIPVSELDLDVDQGMFTPGEPGFERRVTALLNHCTEGYETWIKQLGKEKGRESATEYLQT